MNPTDKQYSSLCRLSWGGLFFATLVLGIASSPPVAAAFKIKIAKAVWSAKSGILVVKGKAKNAGGPIDIYDINGRRLGGGQGGSFALTLGRPDLASVPCAVRVQVDGAEAIKAVQGAPRSCAKPLTCRILAPDGGTAVRVGEDIRFEAVATSKDPAAQPFTYEWDFAGGSMGEPVAGSNPPAFKRPTGTTTTIQFVRNDSRYRVRFIATDAKGRRCEDAVEVIVGEPPAGLPAKVSEQPAPRLGEELDGSKGDVVVLPFEEWTYQNASDMRLVPNGYSSFSPTVYNLRAYAYKKDRLPVLLGTDEVELRYSAASNPSDPVGVDSINSTSRNWPTTAAMLDAVLKKSDAWEIPTRPDEQKAADYFACSWMMTGYWGAYGCDIAQGRPTADEGYFKAKKDETGNIVSDDPNTDLGHGAYMPGRDNPYFANAPQTFSRYEPLDSLFEANLLPFTDADDQGRVNPFSLVRVEAVAKGSDNVLAKTDGVVSAGRDFHCRECHAKGKVAANPGAPHTKATFASSTWGRYAVERDKNKPGARYYIPEDKIPEKPQFFDVSDFGGDPHSIADQEYAAALNYSSLHQYYDAIAFLNEMQYAIGRTYLTEDEKTHPTNIGKDTPRPCYGCHATALSFEPFQSAWWDEEGFDVDNLAYAPNYSIAMHRFHAELQWNQDKTDIVRDEKGRYVRWDWKTKGPNNSTKTGSLFPIFDDQGRQLPMEQNCLRCHAGHREQLYRDRMYTAGVTCYDCHGDMLAVGEAFPKNYLANKDKLGSFNRDDYRVPWFDEPDCGSCHIGDGNLGKGGGGGFFSEGVLKTAFDPNDWSATTRSVDRSDPDSRRFAVAPKENYRATFPTEFYAGLDTTTGEWIVQNRDTQVDAPVYRFGKDTHGNVACAACHGAAHSVWPNRDPSANDNVTALQLQGHAGHVLECNVCHTADSFAKKEDLDGGQYSGDPTPGILGGPHNMHPVNDPYWWKEAPGDTSNHDGTTYGGWHNDYAKLPGAKGEDQCAACHGNDHKGTRLSKTPVDRVFDFRGFDTKKLKKVGFKSKIIRVVAGTPIGCDTCHSLETSFHGVPGH